MLFHDKKYLLYLLFGMKKVGYLRRCICFPEHTGPGLPGSPGCGQDTPPTSGTQSAGFPLGYGDLAERIEFAVPDGVGVPGVI